MIGPPFVLSAVKGQPIGMNASGTVSVAVPTTAKYSLSVTWNSVPLFNHANSTCGDSLINLPLDVGTVDITGLTCPIAAGGNMALDIALTLPPSIPSVRCPQLHSRAHDVIGALPHPPPLVPSPAPPPAGQLRVQDEGHCGNQ